MADFLRGGPVVRGSVVQCSAVLPGGTDSREENKQWEGGVEAQADNGVRAGRLCRRGGKGEGRGWGADESID